MILIPPCHRLIADCVQLVIIVPDPRSLIVLDSVPVPIPVIVIVTVPVLIPIPVPVPVPVSLGPGSSRGSDGLEQFISLTGHLTRARGG